MLGVNMKGKKTNGITMTLYKSKVCCVLNGLLVLKRIK